MDDAIEREVRFYLAQVSPERMAQTNSYIEGGHWLIISNLLVMAVATYLILRTGLNQKINDFSERVTKSETLRTVVYIFLCSLVYSALLFPLTVFQGYFRERAYGLLNYSLGTWFLRYLQGTGLRLLFGAALGAVIFVVIRKFSKMWWLFGALAMTTFAAVGALIVPVFIQPIFYQYKPLRNGEAREAILALAHTHSIPASEIYEFNASQKSNRISANVTGFMGTTRISLNDNLLTRSTLPEIRHVMAHEIGHYVLGHSYVFVVFHLILFSSGLFLIKLTLDQIIRKWGSNFEVSSIRNRTVWPILLILILTFQTLALPITNTVVRTFESQADQFALNLVREPDAAAHLAILQSDFRKMSAHWLEELLFFDHPSGESRIRAAIIWKTEHLTK